MGHVGTKLMKFRRLKFSRKVAVRFDIPFRKFRWGLLFLSSV